jgi:hypothetical protein
MAYELRETRSLPPHALAALIARKMALTALAALGLSGDPFREPFHGQRRRFRRNIVIDAETAQLVVAAVQAALRVGTAARVA